MAILTQVTQLVNGVDTVTAEDIMDTQETAINANTNAGTALDNSVNAVSSANAALAQVQGKQDQLESGTNIKTINNQSILGSGNLEVTSLPYSHVGQVIMTTSTTFDPAQIYGGTWEQLTADAYLKIVTSNFGSLGGTSSDHKIPISSMPSHTHSLPVKFGWGAGAVNTGPRSDQNNPGTDWFTELNYTGGGNAYYPYYYGVKVWRRTA